MQISIIEIIQSASVITASVVAIYGISSWRREAKWKRKYELAEEVLSCFYQISEIFDIMRNPSSHSGEGSTRKRGINESEEDSERLDSAYVLIERYEKHKDVFLKLNTVKYRFMALYGKDAIKPFDDIMILRNKLFHASIMLAKYRKFLRNDDADTPRGILYSKKIDKLEKLFWADYGEPDEFKNSVDDCIVEIEKICKLIIERN